MSCTHPATNPSAANANCTRRGTGNAAHTPPLTSAALLQGHAVVHIEHNGSVYRLQATRQGKLILTK